MAEDPPRMDATDRSERRAARERALAQELAEIRRERRLRKEARMVRRLAKAGATGPVETGGS